jgi:hypothetical protein
MDGVGWYKMEGGCTEKMDTGEWIRLLFLNSFVSFFFSRKN